MYIYIYIYIYIYTHKSTEMNNYSFVLQVAITLGPEERDVPQVLGQDVILMIMIIIIIMLII